MAGVPVLVPALFAANATSPASGAKIYAYLKSTVTPQAIYTSDDMGTEASNPVVANSLGAKVFYLDPALNYDLVAKTSDDATTLFSVTYNVDANNITLGTGWDTVLALPAAGILDNLAGVRFVSTKAALKALATATGLSSGALYDVLGGAAAGDGFQGEFRYTSSDMSATVVKATKTVSAVDTTRDLLYSASHGFLTNDGVIASAADAGLSLNTVYYVRTCEETAALAQGTTPASVATGAFLYSIGSTIYSKTAVAAGTAPGNDVVPLGKWGCVAFEIGADGTIDAIEAPDNATGYAEKYLARNALPAVQASHIRIGDVCVTKSDGGFTFGTTSLSASNVNAIYTQATPRTFMPDWFSLHTSFENASSDAGSSKVNITTLTSLSLKELLDPYQGIYVMADGADLDGSDGCFVRTTTAPIKPDWFGTDVADALQAAAQYGLNKSDHARIQYDTVGDATFDRKVKIWLPDTADGSQDTASLSKLHISGAGRGITRLKWTSGAALHFIYNAQGSAVEVTDLSMVAGASSVDATRKAIVLENHDPYGFFGEFTERSRISVDFHGSDGVNLTNFWTYCVDILDVSNVDFQGSTFNGASTPAGAGIRTRAYYGNFVTVFEMSGCAFRFLTTGYEYGTGSQTANLGHAFFAQNTTDVVATLNGTDHQGLVINDSEAYKGASGNGVEINCRVPNFMFTNNKWAIHAANSAVVMTMQDMTTITGNQFFPDASANTATSAIDINNTVSGSVCIIDHNNFASTTVGARLLSASADVYFGAGNVCTSGMTLVSDAGSGNDVYPLGVLPTITSAVRSSSATLGVGYATGAGGAVTQATSKSTTVVLNKVCGYIVMNNATLNAGATVSFTFTNSAIAAFTDVLAINIGDGTAGAYVVNAIPGTGTATIQVTNISAGNLGEALTLRFAVIKGVAA